MDTELSPFLRVGIIGSGIGGAAAAYFVRDLLGAGVEIVAFEKAARIGGRIYQIEVGGLPVEAGGNLIHSSNRYLNQFIEALDLQRRAPHNLIHPSVKRTSGIWNGRSFDFKFSSSELANVFKMIRRYSQGPTQIRPIVAAAVNRWVGIYDLQEEGETFATPAAMLEALAVSDLFEDSGADFFQEKGIDQHYVDEFVTGLARYDFGQDTGIHALANIMSLIGTGIRGQNYVVKGGNQCLCQALLEEAGAEIRMETTVRRIARRPSADETADRYELQTDQAEPELFDAVIIATPLELSDLTFHNIDLPESASIRRPFQTIYTTFVRGELSPNYFGQRSQKDLPNFIMTREEATIPFLSISDVGQIANSATRVYKIFSRSALSDSLLEALFDDTEATEQVIWQAWPILTPAAALPPFALAEGLYYINAMESLVPTMEAAVIASRNVVNLLDEELLEPVDDEE